LLEQSAEPSKAQDTARPYRSCRLNEVPESHDGVHDVREGDEDQIFAERPERGRDSSHGKRPGQSRARESPSPPDGQPAAKATRVSAAQKAKNEAAAALRRREREVVLEAASSKRVAEAREKDLAEREAKLARHEHAQRESTEREKRQCDRARAATTAAESAAKLKDDAVAPTCTAAASNEANAMPAATPARASSATLRLCTAPAPLAIMYETPETETLTDQLVAENDKTKKWKAMLTSMMRRLETHCANMSPPDIEDDERAKGIRTKIADLEARIVTSTSRADEITDILMEQEMI
jgi:hypothetical protein